MTVGPGEPSLSSMHWRTLIVDEAHRLKNAESKLLQSLKGFSFDHLVLLTGTPLQNNGTELYTLLNFLEPSKFPSEDDWTRRFGDLQTKTQVEKLNEAMRPFLLRRMKADVEKSVPPKEETIVEVELTTVQKQYYRAIYERNVDFLASNTNHTPTLMNVVMELRKCCNHPYLINGAEQECLNAGLRTVDSQEKLGEQLIYAAGKMVLIHKLLPKLKAQGHKVLIFSQMVRVLDLMEDYLRWQRYSYERIDGHVKGNDRQAAIDRYSNPELDRFVFLLCTRAGGVGINLTAADTVVIYDSDWNPQNDLQAQARCHRIGQTKGVKVYRLVTRNSYEAVMFQKASLKLGLDQAVLNGVESSMGGAAAHKKLTAAEVKSLLRHGAYGALQADDSAAKFCEEDIDEILGRSAKVQHYEAAAEANSTFAKAHFAVNVGGTDVSVDDPEFWNKVGIVATSTTSKEEVSLGERKRRQVKRLGMGRDSAEEDDRDEDSQAEKLLLVLLRCGLHRVQALPALAKLSYWEIQDVEDFAFSFVLLCAKQIGASDEWPIVSMARSIAPRAPPSHLTSMRMQDRLRTKAREDLVRLHQLHAIEQCVTNAAAAAGVSAEDDQLSSLDAATVDTVGMEVTRLINELKEGTPVPAEGWGPIHDGRLLLGVYLFGWSGYELLRRHEGLWEGVPRLLQNAGGDGNAEGPTLDWKNVEKRLKAVVRMIPGAAPPKEPQVKDASVSRGPVETASPQLAVQDDLEAKRDTHHRRSEVKSARPENNADQEVIAKESKARHRSEDAEWRPEKAKPSKEKASAAPKERKAKVQKEAKERVAGLGNRGASGSESEREAIRRELQEALLAFGEPETKVEWKSLLEHVPLLADRGLQAVQKAAYDMKRSWEIDGKGRDEVAKSARSRLLRLEILSTLRRYTKLSSPPPLGKDLEVASWWCGPRHDLPLVQGVLRHGFGRWAQIFGDETLFSPLPDKMPGKTEILQRLKHLCDALNNKTGRASSSQVKPSAKAKIPALDVTLPKLPKFATPKSHTDAGAKSQGTSSAGTASLPLSTKQHSSHGQATTPSTASSIPEGDAPPNDKSLRTTDAKEENSEDEDDMPIALLRGASTSTTSAIES